MKNLIITAMLTLSCLSVLAMSNNDSLHFESKTPEGINHFGTVPYYVPFVSMFMSEKNTVKEWSVAFAMIIGVGDSIFVESLDTVGACNKKDCKNSWELNIYSQNNTNGSQGKNLEKWLFNRGTELRRELITYNGKNYQLATFIIKLDAQKPTEAPFKVLIGDHPHGHRIHGLHEGGAIHWPTGS